jgi:Lysozyme like domain/Ricin-type beta-trefoil lectin domain
LIRSLLVTAVAVVGVGALAAAGSSGDSAAGPPGAAGSPARSGGLPTTTGVIPAALRIQLSPAQVSAAAGRCAAWADRAGFADNGYVGGSLTTAIAVAIGESGCNPAACYDDTTGQECTPASTSGSHDSIDRGVWQINSRAWPQVSNSCAFRGLCNAKVAYGSVSADGSFFGPWTVYLTDHYAQFVWAAQQAVNALRGGTITSGLLGSCAAYAAGAPGAQVRLANCGSGSASQQWTTSASTLRTTGGLCLTAAPAAGAPVTVLRCTGSRVQDWERGPGSGLRNAGTGLCLADAGSSRTPGHLLTGQPCARRQGQAWFRP